MTERRAACSCGQLSVTCEGEPVRISICHCLACQRRTGSAFGAQARWPREQIKFEGTSGAWVRTADSGNTLTFHFCPECGSTVYYVLNDAPDIVAVAIGTFADPNFPTPKFSVYETRKHAWVGVPEDIAHFD
jgi:hypothetical protein